MRTFVFLVTIGAWLIPSTVSAKPHFVNKVPNGSVKSCATCHVNGQLKTVRNVFGQAVGGSLVGGLPNWSAVCDLDSDGDGFSNGAELLDPDCSWVAGSGPGCAALVGAPGDPNMGPGAAVCGDGVCEAGENLSCCPDDCLCGNGQCDANEDFDSCPADCEQPPIDEGTSEPDVQVETDSEDPPEDSGPSGDATEPSSDVSSTPDSGPSGDATEPSPDVSSTTDSGSPDASSTPDGDAPDAGTPADAGQEGGATDTGGCASGGSPTLPFLMGLSLIGWALLRTRRTEKEWR